MRSRRNNTRNRSTYGASSTTNLPNMGHRQKKTSGIHTVNIDKIKSIDLTAIFRKYSK